MSVDEKSDVPRLLEQTGVKYHYTYGPTISETQLVIEVPDNAKLSNELLVLIEKLRNPDDCLSARQEELYKQLLTSSPSVKIDQSIVAKPLLERRNVVIKITRSLDENNGFLGKKNNNLTAIVSHFKRKRLEDLYQRIYELKEVNSSPIRCAITGVAGCGKSELAKAYAWELPDSPDIFRWRLDPDSTQNNASDVSYQQAYAVLLHNFGLEFRKAYDTETSDQIHQRLIFMIWQKINQYSQWVVVFDNAVSIRDIEKYLPTDFTKVRGYILITTQSPLFFTTNKRANFSINKGLDHNEAVELLKEISHRKQEAHTSSVDLVRQLDYSPLGIRIAGSYIYNMKDATFATYIKILEKDVKEQTLQIMSDGFISQAVEDPRRIGTLQSAIRLSINKIKEHNCILLSLLEYCAFLSNENIPFVLLLELFKQLDQLQQESIVMKGILEAMMVGRNNYSLLTYDSKTQSYHLHRTTQVVLRTLNPFRIDVIRTIVVTILKLYPYNELFIDEVKMCRKMEPHFLALRQHIMSDPMILKALVTEQLQLLLILGKLASRFSQYSQGLQYLQEAWQLTQVLPNACLEIQVDIIQYLGQIKYCLSEYKEATQYLEESIQIGKKVYGSTDWHLARFYNRLGQTLRQDPNASPEKALQIYRLAEQICWDIQPPIRDSDLQLASSYDGMGRCFGRMRDFPGALKYFNKALKILRQYLGDSSPFIAGIYQNLGRLGLSTNEESFVDVGIDYQTSREYIEQTLSSYIKTYGSASHEVVISYSWLARLLYTGSHKEDWEKALQYQNQVINLSIEIIGYTSQELIVSYYWKGRILQKLNREEDARNAYQQSLEVGQQHSSNLTYWIQKSQRRLDEIKSRIT